MAPPTTPADLRALIERSGLLPSQLIDPAFAAGDQDPAGVARRLVNDALLTPFQARQLRKGRADGFFLTDKYKILDFIGSGGMGKVYLCEHLILHRLVAVKLLQLPAEPGADASRAFERFYREARAVARLDDPNIIRVFDVDRVGPNPFMVMEYADGTNLHDVVARHCPLPFERACHYIRQGALGLQHAHEAGLIHRDIKPGNLILDRSGTVKLLDLGLARFAQDPARNQGITDKYDKHLVIGTADFMAPEQAFDSAAVDIRSDVYGLGCTFYFLLTGKVPFPDRSVPEKMYAHKTRAPAPVSELCPRLPAGVLATLEKMMAKEQAERYQTPAGVIEALAEWTAAAIPPPPDKEMPEHRAAFYRLGLSPAPGPGSALAVTPNPSSSAETLPTRLGEWDVPGYNEPDPSADSGPSIVVAPQPRPPTIRRRTILRNRWLVRGVELVVFAAAAGLVAWLVARRDRGPEVVYQPGPTPAAPFVGTILNGGGSTFVHPVVQRWTAAYEKQHGVKIDFQPVGSGKGIQGVLDRVYLFGCSDVVLTEEQLAEVRDGGGEVVHIPLILGAVAVTYNLPDVKERLKFAGPVLADIYLGKIRRWDDPVIAINNPGVSLPDLPITVVHRAESSGTSFIWTDYLSKASAEWKAKCGATAEPTWPTGVPARGNNGVATIVSRTAGTIGYVELSYALENNLPAALVKNRDGKYVAAGPASVTAAARARLKSVPPDLRFTLTDASGEEAYPIAGAAWAILYADQTKRPAGRDLVAFLRWATHEGQAYAAELRFAPLPPELVKRIDDRLGEVRVAP